MLSDRMAARLNKQIGVEYYSSNLYLQMASWCQYKGFCGAGKFFKAHAAEELQHMHKLYHYMNETGALAIIGDIKAPPYEFDSLFKVFEATLEHEIYITSCINSLVKDSFDEGDFATFNFLQWYVAEQHEEETLFKGILDLFTLMGEDGKSLYFIDKEIARLADEEK